MEEKRFKFIPALSAGSLFSGIKAGNTFADGTRYDFWNFEDEFRYPYFLITAGHFYKRKNVAEDYSFFNENPDNVIFGDSGGFQISMGAIKWDLSLREIIFKWLEENSSLAANLDIPTASNIFSYDECLKISKSNFDYFHKNQTGRTDFLNVIQGYNFESYNSWYEEVKEYRDFAGWCIGNARFSLSNLIDAFYIFLKNDEHKRSKYWHILGASSPHVVVAMCHIQNALNQIGHPVQIFSDSSSPNATRYGYYYWGLDWKALSWKTIHIPYMRDTENMEPHVREIYESGIESLPLVSKFDKERYADLITYDDVREFNSRFASSLSLRNTMLYVHYFEMIQDFAKMPEYYRIDIFNKDIAKLGTIINQMAEVSNDKGALERLYKKSKPFLKKFKNKSSSKTNYVQHDFFE